MPRAQAPHFKVLCSVRNHMKVAEVYADNRLLATWVRLGIHAVEAYADRTDDVFIVPDAKLTEITGVGRADIARKSLERLADVSPISVKRLDKVWEIRWPNFAKKQFPRREDGTYTVPTRPDRGGSASASASASTTTEREKSARPQDSPRDGQSPLSLSRADALWEEVARAAGEHGSTWNRSHARVSLLAERLRDGASEAECVNAVHGYVRVNGLTPNGSFDPARYFTPETIFKADKFAKYADSKAEPRKMTLEEAHEWYQNRPDPG